MNTETATGLRRKILMMVLCGMTSAAALGGVSATAGDSIPSISFKFDPHSLDTESGTRELYARLQRAAEEACPATTTGTLLPSGAALHCRQELIGRVVMQINHPRLVALYNSRTKNG